MLNALPSSTYFGTPDPLQAQANLPRVNAQILTNDFERLTARSVEHVGEDSGTSALKNSMDAYERGGRIREREMLVFLKHHFRPFRFEVALVEGDGKIRGDLAAVTAQRNLSYASAAYYRAGEQYRTEASNPDGQEGGAGLDLFL